MVTEDVVGTNLYHTLYVVVVAPLQEEAKFALDAPCKLGCVAGLLQVAAGVSVAAVPQDACP